MQVGSNGLDHVKGRCTDRDRSRKRQRFPPEYGILLKSYALRKRTPAALHLISFEPEGVADEKEVTYKLVDVSSRHAVEHEWRGNVVTHHNIRPIEACLTGPCNSNV